MSDAKDVHDTLKAIAFMVQWSPAGVQVITTDALKDILDHIDTLTQECADRAACEASLTEWNEQLTRERDEAREERENVSSQLWDCMGERDGLRNRLATCETALAVVLPYVRVIREPRMVDSIGEIHGDRDRVYLNGMALRYQQYSAAVLDLLRTAALTPEDV
jgi:hypothetical protein